MTMHLKTHPRIWSSISQLIIYKPLNAQMKKKICEKTQILDGNKLSSAYAKRQTNERFMTWIFPRAPKCLKSNFYLVLNKSHLSNITLDRPWTPSKKVWHSPAENASNRHAPSWGCSPKQQSIPFLLPSTATGALIPELIVPQSPQTHHLPHEQKAFDCKRQESLMMNTTHKQMTPSQSGEPPRGQNAARGQSLLAEGCSQQKAGAHAEGQPHLAAT